MLEPVKCFQLLPRSNCHTPSKETRTVRGGKEEGYTAVKMFCSLLYVVCSPPSVLPCQPLMHLSYKRLDGPASNLPRPTNQDGRGPASSTNGQSTGSSRRVCVCRTIVTPHPITPPLRPALPCPPLPRPTPPHPTIPRAPGGRCTTAPGTCGTRTPRPPERTDRTGPGRGRCATRCRRCSKPSAGPPQQPAHPPHPLLLLPRSPV